MKRYLMSLIGAALVGTAYGQAPATPALAATMPAPAATAPCATPCPATCVKTKTICVPEPTTVKKTKICFSSDCATVCSKGCGLFRKHANCDSCPTGSCGHPHVERYLYKRVQTTVCDSHKCVPVQVPVCAAPKCAKGSCRDAAVSVDQQPATAPPANRAVTPNVEVLVISPTAATTR